MIHVSSVSYEQAKRLMDRVRYLISDEEEAKTIAGDLEKIQVDIALSLDHAYVAGMMDYKKQLKENKNGWKKEEGSTRS